MEQDELIVVTAALEAQRQHWDETFAQRPKMFGAAPSEAARRAAEVFQREGVTTLLELGGGQRRDTLFFAQRGFRIWMVDYSASAVDAVAAKAQALGLSHVVTTVCHDIRQPLPFPDAAFEACYSHMLYCMALTTPELARLSQEGLCTISRFCGSFVVGFML